MNEQEVNEALAHVREIQTLVLDHQRFTGFSGVARMLGGVAALIIAWVLQTAVPPTIHNHLMGWGVLLLIGVVANFAGLACWVLNRHRRLDSADWWAVLEVFPALIVGGALVWHLDVSLRPRSLGLQEKFTALFLLRRSGLCFGGCLLSSLSSN